MITIYDVESGESQVITPTIFPDGTSQIWKIGVEKYKDKQVKIIWNFESEAELIWVHQLYYLLIASTANLTEIYIPYLPYARQDKPVSDESTFALYTLRNIISSLHCPITTLDVHSSVAVFRDAMTSYSPEVYIENAIEESQCDVIVFPDEGAYNRYSNLECFDDMKFLVLDKVRDQSTGKIISLELNKNYEVHQGLYVSSAVHRFLIVDDICDGGATFVNTSMFIHKNFKAIVSLYVTHGIFSQGFDKLIDSGIKAFYTTQSLPKNKSGYKLQEINYVI